MDIGAKVKELRQKQNLTLRDLGEKTGLSIGFLSQFERNLTTIAVDSLQSIADALSVNLSTFLAMPVDLEDQVIYGHSQTVALVESECIHTYLSTDLEHHDMFPELVTILPRAGGDESKAPFAHEGEEFLYVVEGVLTLNAGAKVYTMYPGDSIHLFSKVLHNWYNDTNRITKILVVHLPNPFKGKK